MFKFGGHFTITFNVETSKIDIIPLDIYLVKIGSDPIVAMAQNMFDVPDNALSQYVLPISANIGDEVVFTQYMTPNALDLDAILLDITFAGTNNLKKTDTGFVVASTITDQMLYFKPFIGDDGLQYAVYLTGYHDTYYISTGASSSEMVENTAAKTDADKWDEQYKLELDLTKDQELTFKIGKNTIIIDKALANAELIDGEPSKVKVHNDAEKAIVYLDVYNKTNHKEYTVRITGRNSDYDDNEYYVYINDLWLNTKEADKDVTFAIYAFNDDEGFNEFIPLTKEMLGDVHKSNVANIWTASISSKYTNVIVLRVNPNYTDELDWDKQAEWLLNKSVDLELVKGKEFIILNDPVGDNWTVEATFKNYEKHSITYAGDTIVDDYSYNTFAKPANPTRDGYTFAEWFRNAELNQPYAFAENPVVGFEDIELFAGWTVVDYEITYDLDGGELPQGKSNPGKYTITTPTFTINNPTKDGYDFAGWTGTGLDFATTPLEIVLGSTGAKSFKATWAVSANTLILE